MTDRTTYELWLQRDGEEWRRAGTSTAVHGLPPIGAEFATSDGWYARVVDVLADDQPPVVKAVEFRPES